MEREHCYLLILFSHQTIVYSGLCSKCDRKPCVFSNYWEEHSVHRDNSFHSFVYVYFWRDRALLCSPSGVRPCYADQASLQHTETCLLLHLSAGIKALMTMSSHPYLDFFHFFSMCVARDWIQGLRHGGHSRTSRTPSPFF